MDWQTFEALVALLMRSQGYVLTTLPGMEGRGGDRGVDFTAISPAGKNTLVIVKSFGSQRQSILNSQMAFAVQSIHRLHEQLPDADIIYVVSADLQLSQRVLFEFNAVTLWDRGTINELLFEFPQVGMRIDQAIADRDIGRIFDEEPEGAESGPKTPPSFADRVAEDIKSIVAGKEGWREFEKIGTRILTEIFLLDLEAPEMQSRTEDGLDIMDAIFAVPYSGSSWSSLRSEFKSRFAIAEFKNYSDSVGQKEVESIVQYLFPKAFRMFGVLVSRKSPSESALNYRRRAWLEFEKMIVFISDDDLIEMAEISDAGGDPFEVIERQLTSFFRTLSP